jgi:hypothetical protein
LDFEGLTPFPHPIRKWKIYFHGRPHYTNKGMPPNLPPFSFFLDLTKFRSQGSSKERFEQQPVET